jgi:hypothetical protein
MTTTTIKIAGAVLLIASLLSQARTSTRLRAHGAAARQAEIAGSWDFARGTRDERLQVSADRMPTLREPVTLPHRIMAPDTALWYSRELELPPDIALLVEADDGAQVFVDGRRLDHYRRWFIVPPELSGKHRVIVRVLNNAMQGGLRRVTVVDAKSVPRPPETRIETPSGFAPIERRRLLPADRSCAFSAWADSQSGWSTFARIVAAMAQRPASFTVGIGDLVSDGSDPDNWPKFVETLKPIASAMPVVAIAGNHDYDGSYNELRARSYEQWFARRQATWFAWSCGPARFVALDMNREFPIGISPGSDQWRWLEAETQSASWTSARWRVLLLHQPPWSRSWEGYGGDLVVRPIVERLARERGLQVVLAGHSHAYEHLIRPVGDRQVHVFITGGAGGSLEDVKANALSTPTERIAVRHHFLHATAGSDSFTVNAIGIDGEIFDSVTLTNR